MQRVRIDAVAFDYGGVLSRPQDPREIERLAKLTRIPVSEFAGRYAKDRLAYDRGILTGPAYWATVVADPAVPVTDELAAELIQVDVASWLMLDLRLFEWAKKLKAANVSIAILSNLPRDVLAGLRMRWSEWLMEFPFTIFSCEVGTVKPEAQIYQGLLDAMGVVASRVLFIDDHSPNVQGAAQAGFHALQYESFERLNQDVLAKFDLPLLIDGARNG